MKGKKIIIFLIIIIILLIGVICNFIKKDYINTKKIIVKTMTGTEYENNITSLNASHEEYANYIQTSKQEIANAINMYPNSNATENNSLEELSIMIENLTTIPGSTYYYENGTEGSNTIERYKKIDGQYYVCDANGTVAEGTSATDVTSKALIEYTSSNTENLSAGRASFVDKTLLLGDGTNNSASVDNMNLILDTGYRGSNIYFPKDCKKALVIFTSAYYINGAWEDDSITSYTIDNVGNQTLLLSRYTCPAMRIVLVEGATTSSSCSMTTKLSYTKNIMIFELN